jgi:hypothetical protein
MSKVEPLFSSPDEYPGGEPTESSYCFSPATLFDPKVFGATEDGAEGAPMKNWSERLRAPDAFRAPPVTHCRYPSYKTHMMEHHWLQNRPDSKGNPFMSGAPWTFNQGLASAPLALFFDGHVEGVACERAMRDDAKVGGLWLRDTPLGETGYYGGQAHDGFVKTSFHILTRSGIAGRDLLSQENINGVTIGQPGREVFGVPGGGIRSGVGVFTPGQDRSDDTDH